MNYKEIYSLPAVNEEIPYDGVLQVNSVTGIPSLAVGDQHIHALVPDGFKTVGTVFWETGMPEPIPDPVVPAWFDGWR